MLFDFSKYPLSNKHYGGTEKKIGVLIGGFPYMLKFQKNTQFGFRYNHISEYIGSHIFEFLGINVHHTFLGTFDCFNVVACKDFIDAGEQFVPFNDVSESTIEENKDKFQYSYQDIIKLLEKNKKITNVEETISSFFDIYIVDSFIGNFDRHGSNWGFIKKDNRYRLAPVFDNGSSLFPQMIDENEMVYVINDENEINERVYKFPTSQIKLNGEKSSYFDVISSLQFDECNKALMRIFPRINLEEINAFIDNIPILSEIHKSFYKRMLSERYNKILKFSYLKLMEKCNG